MRALSLTAVLLSVPISLAAASQEPERWRLLEEARIGSVDDPADALSRIGDVRLDSDGHVYLWQGQSSHMLAFDSRGERSHVIGGRGAGPGEFVGNIVLWTWKADTLAAFDRDQQRYSLFLPNGTHVRTGRVLQEGSIGTVVLEWMLEDGSVVGWPRERTEEGVPRPRLRYAADGTFLDTLFTLRTTGAGAAVVHLPRNLVMTFHRPLMSSDLVARDPLGRHVTVTERAASADGGSATFRVYRIGLRGDTLFDRRYRYTPRPVDEVWADSVEAAFRATHSGRSVLGRTLTPAELDQMVAALAIPEYYPPISEAVVGRDGSAWLRRQGVAGSEGRWVVLDDSGMLVATVRGPADLEIQNVRGDEVWGVVHDELDVPYLVRYRAIPW